MRSFLPALLPLLAATAACGDFSQEDLLFMAALPPKESVELRPAGVASTIGKKATADGQALERACEENDLRCQSENIAGGFNKVTFDLLDLVDAVVRQPPTSREKNRRVWGPHFDAAALSTFRFEMIRSDDGATFAFCFHAKRGAVRWGTDDEISCAADEDDKSGMVLILEGQFTPGDLEGAAARSGFGSMTLHTRRMADTRGFASKLDITFDNTNDRTEVNVDLTGVPIAGRDETREAAYSFARAADGSGLFSFEVFVDLVEPLVGTGPERLTIKAAWLADQSGRADGSVTEGDAPPDAEAHQCWDGELATTWLAPYGAPATGDEASCSITESLLVD